jgi:hypothetical protein
MPQEFLPPRTTALVQPMDMGNSSSCLYVRHTRVPHNKGNNDMTAKTRTADCREKYTALKFCFLLGKSTAENA